MLRTSGKKEKSKKNTLTKRFTMSLYFYLRHNRFVVILAIFLLVGILFGSLIFKFIPQKMYDISLLSEFFFENRLNQSFIETVSSSFISSFFILFLSFLLGFWALSAPLIFFIPFFYGAGIGITIGNLYLNFGFQGFLISLTMILPVSMFLSLIFINSSKDTASFSFIFLSVLKNQTNPEKNNEYLKNYCAKYFLYLILILIASIISGLCSAIFLRFFI